MNIGILPDGSLSERLKGDLYWRKSNLLSRSMAEKGISVRQYNSELLVLDILTKYEEKKNENAATEPDGLEFKPYPPTASGRDASTSGIVRAMLIRDRYLKKQAVSGSLSEEESTVLDMTSRAVKLFFHLNRYDVDRGEKITGDPKREEIKEYVKTVKEYYKYICKISKNEVPEDEKASENGYDFEGWKDRIIPFEDVDKFRKYVPENYLSQIEDGILTVTATYDKDKKMKGVSITADHERWLEIVWLSFPDEKTGKDAAEAFLTYILERGRSTGNYLGAFMELHKVDGTEKMLPVLKDTGMDVTIVKNNIYEFTLKEVKKDRTLVMAADRMLCTPLNGINDAIADAMAGGILEGSKPVPVLYPVPWDNYRKDLSHLFLSDESAGMILFSELGDSIIFDLAYSSNSVVLAGLIGAALKRAGRTLSPDQKILVPIVSEETRALASRLIPHAKRGNNAEACIWY